MIPKIIHIVWIGNQSLRPERFIQSWRDKHSSPEWEVILWTEEEVARRGLKLTSCSRQFDEIYEINGKADILRWQILFDYGGIAVDADSFCLEPLDEKKFLLQASSGWSVFENEIARKNLIACGAMGFPPQCKLVGDILQHISTLNLHPSVCRERAWMTVAVTLLTKMIETGEYPDFRVYPSHTFIPHHFTGIRYTGHRKVYAYQEWGSTKQNYDKMGSVEIPVEFSEPTKWVSVLIASYNRPKNFIRECLNSIRDQQGHFGMEVVFIDDGNDEVHANIITTLLQQLQSCSRFIRVVHKRIETNGGIGAAMQLGVSLCSHELIVHMDDDDIMVPDRIARQMMFMEMNEDCAVCGGQIRMFRDGSDKYIGKTNHPYKVTWNDWKKTQSVWFMNHPTLCWRKSKLVQLGGYNPTLRIMEDFEAELRCLKRFGAVYNMPDVLVRYRLHDDQLTHRIHEKPDVIQLRQVIIENILI